MLGLHISDSQLMRITWTRAAAEIQKSVSAGYLACVFPWQHRLFSERGRERESSNNAAYCAGAASPSQTTATPREQTHAAAAAAAACGNDGRIFRNWVEDKNGFTTSQLNFTGKAASDRPLRYKCFEMMLSNTVCGPHSFPRIPLCFVYLRRSCALWEKGNSIPLA